MIQIPFGEGFAKITNIKVCFDMVDADGNTLETNGHSDSGNNSYVVTQEELDAMPSDKATALQAVCAAIVQTSNS